LRSPRGPSTVRARFFAALDDDLNTSGACRCSSISPPQGRVIAAGAGGGGRLHARSDGGARPLARASARAAPEARAVDRVATSDRAGGRITIVGPADAEATRFSADTPSRACARSCPRKACTSTAIEVARGVRRDRRALAREANAISRLADALRDALKAIG
jgi:hypothetical protein